MNKEKDQIRTYEELIMGRIAKAFEAMDNTEDTLFDEVLDEIEMLFKLVPELGEEYEKKKKQLTRLAQESYLRAKEKIEKIDDEYMRRIWKEMDDATISWDYRKDMLENALKILAKYNMIPFTTPLFATIESKEEEEIQEEENIQPETTTEKTEIETEEEIPIPATTLPKRKIKFKIRKANQP